MANPTELQLTDQAAAALSGTTDSKTGVKFITIGESEYYTSDYRKEAINNRILAVVNQLRVVKDGDLSFGVWGGEFFDNDALRSYAGAAAQSLVDDAINYIYLTAAGVLTKNTTGFPVPSVTAHMPLAIIKTGSESVAQVSGEYDHVDITDCRGRMFAKVCGNTNASLNELDHQKSVLDEIDFTSAEPSSPSVGGRYINTATGSSSVTAQSMTDDYIYEWNGTNWTEIIPDEGFWLTVEDRNITVYYGDAGWVDIDMLTLTSGGDADALHTHASKADKDAGAVENNFAKFNANGNPVDSGKNDADYEDAGAVSTHEGTYDHTDLHAAATAGNGVELTGQQVAVKPDATGGANLAKVVDANANGVAVKIDDTTVGENVSNQLEVKDGGLTESKMSAAATQTITGPVEIAHNNKDTVLLTINVTAGTAACTIADGVRDGQELTLLAVTKTANEIEILDAGSEQLSGKWYQPAVGYGLKVKWDGSAWNETGRFSNTNTNSGLDSGNAGGQSNINSGNYAGNAGGKLNTNGVNGGSVGGYSNTNGTNGGSVGGRYNYNGSSSGSLGGEYNNNSALYSCSLAGAYGVSPLYAQVTHAAGRFAATGDAQGFELIARNSVIHSDANWYTLFLDGVDDLMSVPTDTVWTFEVQIVGTTQGCTKSFGFLINGVIENDGGTTTLLASNVTTLYDTDDSDFDAQAVADDTNDALLIQVQDSTSGGDVVRWVATVKGTCVNFPA